MLEIIGTIVSYALLVLIAIGLVAFVLMAQYLMLKDEEKGDAA